MIALLRIRRELSLLALASLLPLTGLIGCASSGTQHIHDEYPDDSYQSFQEQLADKDVAIHLGDGTVRHGTAVLINSERTSWQETEQTERSQAATIEVWKLEASEGSQGVKGAVMGLLIGGGLGAVMGAASDTDSDYGDAGMGAAIGAIAFGLVGFVIGAIAGGSTNPTTTYEINPDLAPPPEPTTEPPNESIDDWFED